MQPSECTSVELVDSIIATLTHWDKYEAYYLGTLIPLIESGAVPEGSAIADIAAELRERLTPEELRRLPQTVAARRAGKEAEAARRRAEKEEQERRQQAEAARKQAEKEEQERRQQEVRQREEAFAARARSVLQSHFLEADQRLAQDPDFTLFADDAYPELRSDFVREWARRELKEDLDDEQAAAVGATGHDVQVVARAGAGKTRTLVTRALFLQRHCGVSPNDLLLLAFNRDAASEMRERLCRSLEHGVPHVMTFHALAHAMVHPEEELLVDDPSAGNLGLSREVQRVIDEHLQSEHHRPLIRDLMLMQFREDWERIIKGGFHLPIDELIAYRSSLPRETLGREYVKSFGERLIANTLFEHDIHYKYERNFPRGGVNYRPDFTIQFANGDGVVIEYFGLKGQPDYDESSANKRDFWAQEPRWAFLEFSPSSLAAMGVEGFSAHLLEQLAQLGVEGRRLSDEELWERIQQRAIDRFTSAMRSFVSRCRKQNLTPENLGRMVRSHASITEAEQLFLEVGISVYSGYVRRLVAAGQEDFDGLMWRAVAMLASGHSSFVRDKGRERGDLRRMRFILIDEFQDFSDLFYGLTQGIRALNPQVEFFCVGDDWQAINGFAGSDLRFFDDFAGHFKDSKRLHVSTNYRSPTRVVEVGNALMMGRGAPAVPDRSDSGWVSAARFSDFTPSAAEQERHGRDDATPALLRLVKSQLDAGRDVVMLSRRNKAPWSAFYAPELPRTLDGLPRFAEHIRSFLPEEDRGRVTASTAHKYKGLEKEAVIILDADMGSYPLIHPDWVFLRLFGDTVERIEAEERRLFYVALTRSRHSLLIMSDGESRESQYLADIRRHSRLELVNWDEFAPVPSLDGARVEVRVFNAYNVRDELKLLRFRWNERGRYWHRSFTEADFDFGALCRQPWAQTDVRIEVCSEDGRPLNGNPPADTGRQPRRESAMLIATFKASTHWPGKTITWAAGRFTREGHGEILAVDVLSYDRQGYLSWANEGLRDWVGSLAIGDPYLGGIVAYILPPVDRGYVAGETHGLIAAAADQTPATSGIQWATAPYWSTSVPGALGTAFGTGAANTDAIIAQNGAGTSYAAGLARAYTGGGYSDWFLPCRHELMKLCLNRVAIGGLHIEPVDAPRYWSSSQYAVNAGNAWHQGFDVGLQSGGNDKGSAFRVRAVRAF